MLINLSKVAECSEVALFENFENRIEDVFTEVPVIVWGQRHILIVLIAPVGIKCHMN